MPPHTRGKARAARTDRAADGITPAHAGKRKTRVLRCIMRRDHPRLRGEKKDEAFMPRPLIGSPPHTRGKASSSITMRSDGRITPAHAGKSSFTASSMLYSSDHLSMLQKGKKTAIPIVKKRRPKSPVVERSAER